MDDHSEANVRAAVALLTAWLGDVDATTELSAQLTIVLVEELGDGDPLEGALNLVDGMTSLAGHLLIRSAAAKGVTEHDELSALSA